MTLLTHLKVLDFSTLLPGPFATLMLADLGADVLKVERPGTKDSWGVNQYLNRSKKSITLDLKQSESIESVRNLVMEYDIVIEQFRPGVMERLGLGYEALKSINPKLIYCSITGYGQTGPYKERPGHDINYISIAGLSGYSGTKKDGPAKNGTQIADLAGGSLHAVIGILSAIIHRERTGLGQAIDISMTDCSFTLNAISAPLNLQGGLELEPEKLMLNGGSFYDFYETKDGRYFSVGSLEPPFRKALCEAIGAPELYGLSMKSDEESGIRFKTAVRLAFLERDFHEWQEIFADFEACAEPVLTFSEAAEHPQLKERGMIVEVPDGKGNVQKQIACPIKTSVFTPEYKHAGLEPGQNNTEILRTPNR
ncbi:CaiB/BaiF CoA transferase family protein [Peribacillus frigoritolerans]|uniref:CaiB/BaiF CoA transferase family protein n=1 Tax=Peribacillus frigoritolerans TaxID=450367 RepID=UPI00207AE066|nr:CaiB/BaiF CoA-transferase family protein [Peribacillus frigoritolerans]USK74615.1 CoA transferase [Peribacillus frigoritolerans]